MWNKFTTMVGFGETDNDCLEEERNIELARIALGRQLVSSTTAVVVLFLFTTTLVQVMEIVSDTLIALK